MRAGDGTLAAWHDGIERLFREREPVFGRLCRFDRWSGTGIPLAGMTAFPGLCDRTLYGQADAGQVGSKVVQVKGVMLLSQHTPGKHRPAKPARPRRQAEESHVRSQTGQEMGQAGSA